MSAHISREAGLTRTIDVDAAMRITRLARLPMAKLGRAKAEHVYAVYYDTVDRDLMREGVSLCLSHSGQGRVQTVTFENSQDFQRTVDVAYINGSEPNIEHISHDVVRVRVATLTLGAPLRRIFETRVLRLTRDIRTEDGDLLCLEIDQGEIQSNSKTEPISELTLALKVGSKERLREIACALELPEISPVARIERGYALSGPPEDLSSTKSSPIVLPKKATVGEALSVSLHSVHAHLLANVRAVIEAQDPEGVHQMRVGLRRLRTVCAAFAPTPAGDMLKALDKKARALGRTLGRARDLDVFLGETVSAAAPDLAAEGSALEQLLKAVRAARAEAWSDAVAAVSAPAFDAFLAEIEAIANRADWPKARRKPLDLTARVKPFGRKRLDSALEAVTALARKLKHLSETQRHTLRKRLKRLRYTGDLFESAFARRRTRQTQKRLAHLQETFGALNDAAIAADLAEAIAADLDKKGAAKDAEAVRRGAALVIAWHRPRAEALFAEARKRWRAFSQGELFWD